MPSLPVVAKTPRKKRVSMKLDLGTAVKQEVAKQIAKKTENKLIMENGRADTTISQNYNEFVLPRIDTTSTYPILPALDVGAEAGLNSRVGGTIEPKALKLRGILSFDYKSTIATAVASRSLDVRLMVLTNKSQRSMPDLVANTGNLYTDTLLWNGQAGDSTSYQGCQPYYNQLPVNRKSWNVIEDRIIHLRKGLGSATTGSQGEVFMSSQRSATFEIVLTAKDMPASLKYDGGLGTLYPTNYAPVFYIGFVDTTGAMNVGDTNSDAVVRLQYTTQLIFEDA